MGHFGIATHLLSSKDSFVNWLNNQRDEVAVGYALMGLDNPVAHWLRSEVPEIVDFEISYDGIELEYMFQSPIGWGLSCEKSCSVGNNS
jgi:hypothetical protein